jgi:hypothetical protein
MRQLNWITNDDLISDNLADMRRIFISNKQRQDKLRRINIVRNKRHKTANVLERVKLLALKAVQVNKDQADKITSIVSRILFALNKNSKATRQATNIQKSWSALLDQELAKISN